jgi:mono/diheme cytochrome c family protein
MKRKVFKWLGIGFAALLGLLLVTVVIFFFVGQAQVNKRYTIAVESLSIPTNAESIGRGQHIAVIHYCQRCHAANFGGEVYFVIDGMLSIPSPNLTSGTGGIGSFYTDEDWIRAIRHGVGHDERALWIMPAEGFTHLSDEDTAALIAYLKSLPPVDNELPSRTIEPMGMVLAGLGMFPPLAVDRIDHTDSRRDAPEFGLTVEYGGYLAQTMCTACHGERLNGIPFGPPDNQIISPNLTMGGDLATWSEEQFFATLHMGQTPDGRILSEEMPWPYFGQMTDDELGALWLYLQSLPALKHGE